MAKVGKDTFWRWLPCFWGGSGKPAVLMFHAGPIQKYFPKQNGLWYLAFRLLFHASGCILCNMASVKREIEKYGVAPKKVQAMFAANYQEEIPVPLPPALEKFLEAHEPRIFSYTMFRPEFTPEVLFEAFARLCEEFPRAGLFIAGPPGVPPEIVAMLKRWGLESRVVVAGNMAHDEFLTAIQRSDVFVRTPVSDGLCASVIEALSLGVPVVAVENGTRPASVITYYPPEAPVLLETLTKVLRNLEQMRAEIQSPSTGSELDDEVSLLVAFANGETR